MIPNCSICDRPSKSWGSLAKHTAQTHKISAEDYFVKYLGQKTVCIHCESEETIFLSMAEGYNKNCPDCTRLQQQMNGRRIRANLSADPVRQQQFIERLSESVKKTWQPRSGNLNGLSNIELNKPEYDTEWRTLGKKFGMGLDKTKPALPQIDAIVNTNLCEEFEIVC